MSPLQITGVQRFPEGPFAVCVGVGPETPSVVDCRKPGRMSAMLSHDDGMNWPDKRGEQLMRAVLQECGTVVLLFDLQRDAEACRAKLLRWAP